jgi:putative transcription antitermination factor YqgF
VLAFDFGEKRIGVAVGECELRSASPLLTFDAETNDARWSAVAGLLAEWHPVLLVVGLPLSPDGADHDMTTRAQRFARQLEGRYRLPVALQDERFTSHEADSRCVTTAASATGAAASSIWTHSRPSSYSRIFRCHCLMQKSCCSNWRTACARMSRRTPRWSACTPAVSGSRSG